MFRPLSSLTTGCLLRRVTLALLAPLAPLAAATAQQKAGPPAPLPPPPSPLPRQLTPADLAAWKTIRSATVSSDGKWLAYILAPNEGDAQVVLRGTAPGAKELRFPIGEPRVVPFSFVAPPAPVTALVVSGDSRWVAFTVYPTAKEAKRLKAQHRPAHDKVDLVNLATGEKTEFDAVRQFAFNGETPSWLAMQGYAAEAPPTLIPTPASPLPPPSSLSTGSDLILRRLTTRETVNVGNVGEFGFDDSGTYLAYTIDARGEIGNGIQLRNMKTDVVRGLDSDAALYRKLAWADSGLALAVLRGTPDSTTRDTLYTVLSFTGFGAGEAHKVAFDPRQHPDFPAGMTVSPDRAPHPSDDFASVFFGIRDAKRKLTPAELMAMAEGTGTGTAPAKPPVIQSGAPGTGGTIAQMPNAGPSTDDDDPSLVLWHWKDPRLQSQQIVQENQDKTYSYLSEYRPAENKFVRLADDALRIVTLMPHDHYAYGVDSRAYDQTASYSGRAYVDFYTVDLRTGERTLALKKLGSPLQVASPDGRRLLYWGDDANYWVMDLASGERRDITKGLPTSFADAEDDHNNLVPPPERPFGWSKDGSAVLLYDGWDAWKVAATVGAGAGAGAGAGPGGGTASGTNLTRDGRTNGVRYQRFYAFEPPTPAARARRAGPDQRGIDFAKPLYFGTYGEWTKKEGFARVEPGTAGATPLLWGDAKYGVEKARDAELFVYTKQTALDFPDYYVASPDFRSGRRLTDANPQQEQFAWSSGVRLVDYVSDKGDKLQGALFLPAHYEPGKKYPLLVTIYEKLSQTAHQYVVPSATSTPNRSIYTSRGYAVLAPDIVYRVNDPGMSAVWSVIPAVKAAIATGIVDSANIGLWGHSWGGYQTAFLVTQTNLFKSAVAGAPLTDLVSMYSSIYWNTGITNQGIFESSQGRFKGNFTDNYDAYIRNSPVFHAANVQTPLLLLHNDKDGAVDFNQGITYFNTLRQLGKDVILLEYVGENHGLTKPVNQKDYAVRQREWFDHYLRGAAAPDWIATGIPRLKMEADFRARREMEKANAATVPATIVP